MNGEDVIKACAIKHDLTDLDLDYMRYRLEGDKYAEKKVSIVCGQCGKEFNDVRDIIRHKENALRSKNSIKQACAHGETQRYLRFIKKDT